MAEHIETGKKGEHIAAGFLQQNGYNILEKNWTNKKFELDIVAKKGNTLFIVEVKTRHSNYLGEPEEWVSKTKQQIASFIAQQRQLAPADAETMNPLGLKSTE